MTSLDVASEAASSRTPAEVTLRESLWKGGVVQVKISPVCREGTFEELTFIQFPRHVKGGVINFFVQGENPAQYCGKVITAEAEVMRKHNADGRSFLYVDLRPTKKPAMYRLIVEQRLNLSIPKWMVIHQFQTPSPLQGIVVIAPLQPIEERKVFKTGDTQLDRLLAAGWQIASETAATVQLVKECGKLKMTHYRSKKKK